MEGAGFFLRGGAGQGSKSLGPGQGKGQNLRGGARVKISGAGQNVSFSADLDHMLKVGKP